MTSSNPFQRWYDREPVLRQALESLRQASDKYQAQIALNIILIVVEHQIESETLSDVEDLLQVVENSKEHSQQYFRRWYDVNETLRSAMQLLHDCPDDVQVQLIPTIHKMVEETLREATHEA
jgi:hypothetical protein